VPRKCTICEHPEREAIEAALVAGELSNRRIATHYGVTEAALRRHVSAGHIPQRLVKAQEAAEAASADTLLAQVKGLQARALAILDKAEAAGDLKTALSAIREVRGNLELLAKLLGELQQEGTVNIYLSPEWLELRALIIRALEPYPEARLAVVHALESP
jgi:DNA-binding transcriptional ArsR family regulator